MQPPWAGNFEHDFYRFKEKNLRSEYSMLETAR
jgi:hypothetical protein